MRQSRLMSLVEAVMNVVVGFGVALGVQMLLFPVFGLTVTLATEPRHRSGVHRRLDRSQLRATSDVRGHGGLAPLMAQRCRADSITLHPISAAQSAERRASLYDELGENDARADPAGGVQALWGVPRAPLSICVSDDEGRSFPIRRVVDDGPGTCLSNDPLDGRNHRRCG